MNSIQILLKDIIMFNCLTMNRLDTQHPPSSDIQQVSQELMFHSSQDLMWKFHPMHGLLFGEEHQWLGVGAPFLEIHIRGKKHVEQQIGIYHWKSPHGPQMVWNAWYPILGSLGTPNWIDPKLNRRLVWFFLVAISYIVIIWIGVIPIWHEIDKVSPATSRSSLTTAHLVQGHRGNLGKAQCSDFYCEKLTGA